MLPGRSDDPAVYAEQALLGALLLRPTQLPRIADQLQPDDFYRPAHQALYQSFLDQHIAGHPATRENADRTHQDAWLQATTRTAAQRARTVTPAYCHQLVDYCPQPAHAPTYARLVLAGSLRRAIATHAHRLAHGARLDALVNEGPANTLTGTPHFAQAVRQATARWGATSSRPVPLPDSPVAAASPPTQQDDETILLGALTGRPDTIPTLSAWLHPDDFTSLTHQTFYSCMVALHHRADPIDPVTLTWEAHHRGILTPHLTTDDINRLITPNGGDPHYWTDRLLQATLIRTTGTVAYTIRAMAADPTIAPGTLLTAATTALSTIAHAHHRWQQAARAAQRTPAGVGPTNHASRSATSTSAPKAPDESALPPRRQMRNRHRPR